MKEFNKEEFTDIAGELYSKIDSDNGVYIEDVIAEMFSTYHERYHNSIDLSSERESVINKAADNGIIQEYEKYRLTNRNGGLFAAKQGSELVKGCWIAVTDVSDIPRINSVVVYATSIPHNLENLFCSVGSLSWSEDFSYGSIIDDGEVVGLSHVKMSQQLRLQ